jgi:conjugal transfer pilus assembly protein TraV
MKRVLAAIAVGTTLVGCSSTGISGLGGEAKLACSAPTGVSCMSVSGLYVNATKGTLPSMRVGAEKGQGDAAQNTPADNSPSFGEGWSNSNVSSAPAAAEPSAPKRPSSGLLSPALMDAPFSGTPLRSAPKVMRIWIAPLTDTDEDLHDQRLLYVTVHTGKWSLEANKVSIERQFRPVFQLGKTGEKDAGQEQRTPGRTAAQGSQSAEGSE